MKILRNILVEMRDGVHIALDVYLPSQDGQDGQYGTVLYFGPYRKDDYILLSGSLNHLPELYTNRGMAFVAADVRGTNDSGGLAVSEFQPEEHLDGAEVVEWIAQQPWCNGKVGMTGVSYGFWTSVETATRHPPHLKAIAPIHGSSSWYYVIHEGGMPMSFGYHGNYAALMLSLLGAPPGIRDERSEEIWGTRLRECVPWGLDWFGAPTDGDAYSYRSLAPNFDCIEVPVFAIGGWWDRYPNEPFLLSEKLKGPVKALIGPWQHARPDGGIPGPRVSYDIILRWFEYWLNDVENGIMAEPPFTYYEQQNFPPAPYVPQIPGRWKHTARWNDRSTTKTRFFLSQEKLLSHKQAKAEGSYFYDYDPLAGFCSGLTGGIYGGGIAMPVDQNTELENSILFSSEPLDTDFKTVGRPELVVHFSSTARRMGIVAKLCDIAPDGTISLITRGYRNVSHRDGLDQPKPATPGTIYRLEVDMRATSYVFSKGHKIGLLINSAEFPSVFPTPDLGINTIYYGADRQSCLELSSLPEEYLMDGPIPPETLDSMPTEPPSNPTYRIEKISDNVWQGIYEATSETRCEGYTVGHNQVTTMHVDRFCPSDAQLTSISTYIFRYATGEIIESTGQFVCQGSADEIEVEAILNVTQNGQTKANRTWKQCHKRDFF